MNFQRADPTAQYRVLRLVSEGQKWELGMSRYHHGMRMRMGLMGRPPGIMDFCMGLDGRLYPVVLLEILDRLESVPEDGSPEAIEAIFPWYGTRPDVSKHLNLLLATTAATEG